MKYIVMCVQDCGGDWPDSMTVEYSGTEHTDRDAARREMASIGRRQRELHRITAVWIKTIKEDEE